MAISSQLRKFWPKNWGKVFAHVIEKLAHDMEGEEKTTGWLPYPIYKRYRKIKDLNVKEKTLRMTEGRREYLSNLGMRKDFFKKTPIAQTTALF